MPHFTSQIHKKKEYERDLPKEGLQVSFFRPKGSSAIKPISKADESRKGDKGGRPK